MSQEDEPIWTAVQKRREPDPPHPPLDDFVAMCQFVADMPIISITRSVEDNYMPLEVINNNHK